MTDDPPELPEADEPHFPTAFCRGSLHGQIISCRIGRHWYRAKASGDEYYKVTTVGPNRELVCLFVLRELPDAERVAAIEEGVRLMTEPKPRVL